MSFKSKLFQKVQYWIRPYLKYKDNVQVSFWATGLHHVTFGGSNIVPEYCAFSDCTDIGFRTTLGTNNFFGGKVSIGKYCQLGRDLAFHPTNHPMSYLTTYVNNHLYKGELKSFKTEKPIKIGNDVWIGHGVIVMAGVNVGNGAILAAGSIVTRDVEPYTIVAGNPAKPIRKRFSEQLIEELQSLKWWDKSDEELDLLKPLFFTDLKEFSSLHPILSQIQKS
ncbi:CatB-related O-acetyltransferase [Algoriphagus persicinus]|uniref:CatB-related O-acetyltransferase n=1 Tax=Algoriphagus persicinus TaxID=3108754 RepID=UPI002B3CE299|nr:MULTISPECIES: CatB-related O-acetyltransferase [unclassified Algoriphagus]MEB2779615.1 CatB-related O-acetyltransferase [Algoriphagus sp. C2-6-M1]MEB2785140.1 CatB-related O-acetyltransferase [Algoriphagus sp. E1-3-M2]